MASSHASRRRATSCRSSSPLRRASGAGAPVRQSSLLAGRVAPLHPQQPRRARRRRRLHPRRPLLPDLADRLAATTRTRSTSRRRASAPSLEHPFGTDKFGRDLLTRTALGGRVSIGIGFAATLVILVIGVTYGSISGFVGGRLDNAHDALPRRALRPPVPAVRDHHARDLRRRRTSGRW